MLSPGPSTFKLIQPGFVPASNSMPPVIVGRTGPRVKKPIAACPFTGWPVFSLGKWFEARCSLPDTFGGKS